ncbi:MAG: hypothetical protein ACRDTJ_12805 [Pseudonocardiaceae bacterium]
MFGRVQIFVGGVRGLGLPKALCDRPLASRSINRDGGPPGAVFVAEVNQQRVLVVLDAEPVARVRCLM